MYVPLQQARYFIGMTSFLWLFQKTLKHNFTFNYQCDQRSLAIAQSTFVTQSSSYFSTVVLSFENRGEKVDNKKTEEEEKNDDINLWLKIRRHPHHHIKWIDCIIVDYAQLSNVVRLQNLCSKQYTELYAHILFN